MEQQQIREIYRSTERLTVVLLIFALPAFGMVYLYQNSGTLDWDLPALPKLGEWLILGAATAILIAQYVLFHQKLKLTFAQAELVEKTRIYCEATKQRFWALFGVSLLVSLGLLLTQSPMFTLLFAVTMVFFSLAKPSPDRMARLMKLKKEDRELIREASRPE
ncbi:hypothetical protein J0A68_15205 [Algoriphagus sp. H41]|uniref:MFS transporter n=1 Tax=Algoriphagus oliviformis TaxID=2811231 RepID=A0ABS3C5B3_9BACT|nr:hypothetical protein [Algoriphagus oliviformis]MBN7812300.1 hypothetical protein [Algoriphagus oliviformis]